MGESFNVDYFNVCKVKLVRKIAKKQSE